jgi:lysine biosynthesis protein LysW
MCNGHFWFKVFKLSFFAIIRNMDTTKMNAILCPECENGFDYNLEGAEVGDIFECSVCGTNLELVSKEPLQVESIVLHK